MPHDAGAAAIDPAPAIGVEKTDNSLFNSVEWQFGHSEIAPERTSVSNWWPHCRQAYSWIGIDASLLTHGLQRRVLASPQRPKGLEST